MRGTVDGSQESYCQTRQSMKGVEIWDKFKHYIYLAARVILETSGSGGYGVRILSMSLSTSKHV